MFPVLSQQQQQLYETRTVRASTKQPLHAQPGRFCRHAYERRSCYLIVQQLHAPRVSYRPGKRPMAHLHSTRELQCASRPRVLQ